VLAKVKEKPKQWKPMGNEYATPENELPYVPDLHINGTVQRHGSLTFWLSNPQFREGYDKIDWGKKGEA
jgi:hypothetical protein